MRPAALAVAAAILAVAPAFAAAPAPAAATSAWTRTGAADTGQGSVIDQGRAVFHNRCSICHSVQGGPGRDGPSDNPGTFSLAFKYKGEKPGALEERTDLTPDVVKFYVRNGAGYMPHFRKTYISDKELDALAAYLTRKR
jgi:mono/diheme cytochrome c family protein